MKVDCFDDLRWLATARASGPPVLLFDFDSGMGELAIETACPLFTRRRFGNGEESSNEKLLRLFSGVSGVAMADVTIGNPTSRNGYTHLEVLV